MLRRLNKLLLLMMLLLPLPLQAMEVQEIQTHGMTAWLVEDHSLPIVTLRIGFRGAGSAYDPQGREGLSTFVASMLNEGAGELDGLAFKQALESRAIELSFSRSKDTLTVELMSLREHFDEAMRLLSLALHAPQMNEEATERTRSQILAALRRLQESPSYIADVAWEQAAYAPHAYSRPEMGTMQGVNAITGEDLRQFAAQRFGRDTMIIGAVGDITPAQLTGALKTHFSALPEKADAQPMLDEVRVPDSGRWVEITRDLPQSVVMFGTQAVARSDPDFYAAYLLSQVFGGGSLSSRMFAALREEKGLTYSAGTYLATLEKASALRGTFATRPQDVTEATERVKQLLREVSAQGISAEELQDSTDYITGSFPLNLDSSDAIAGYLVSMQFYDLGIDYLQKRNSYFRAVTLEDVNRLAPKMLDEKSQLIVKVGKAGS